MMLSSRREQAAAPLPPTVVPTAGTGRFVVLVGIDGSGKSTLLSALGSRGLRTANWRDLRDHDLPQVMAPEAPTRIKSRLSGVPRMMFVGGHFVAQYEYLVRPALETGHDIVLDSYWYKVFAKEKIFGRLHLGLTDLCRELPVPDTILFLDTDPGTAYERKRGVITAYEYLDGPTRESFISFQERLRSEITNELAAVPGVHVLSGDADPETVLSQAVMTLAATPAVAGRSEVSS